MSCMNPPDHFLRQAANCACCGFFVKGVDSDYNQNPKSTLDMTLDKGSATGLTLAWW